MESHLWGAMRHYGKTSSLQYYPRGNQKPRARTESKAAAISSLSSIANVQLTSIPTQLLAYHYTAVLRASQGLL